MKISVLSYSLSNNCLGRAYVLAEVLKRKHSVEILGPVTENGIWTPLKDMDIPYRTVPFSRYPSFFRSASQLLKMIDGDVIYAVKPVPTSFGLGLLKKLSSKRPLILDIDDLESGPLWGESVIPLIRNPNSELYIDILGKLIRFADRITTVSKFLNNKYGGRGYIVPHGRDQKIFDPALYDKNKLKKEMGLGGHKIIMFLGTPRAHKGLEELSQIVRDLNLEGYRVKFVLVGNEKWYRFLPKLLKKYGDVITCLPTQPFKDVAKTLSVADLVVLPQKNDPQAYGQIPVKMIDAMAMAKPIISTKISDIPEILEGCGITVEPGDLAGIKNAIKFCLDNENAAVQMGLKAREKFLKYYTYDAMEEVLGRVFSPFEK